MKSDLNLHAIGPAVSHFFHRYHIILFVIFVVGGLATATFFLSQALTSATTETTTTAQSGFDTKTIDNIKALRSTKDPSTPLTMPSGRTNPFQ